MDQASANAGEIGKEGERMCLQHVGHDLKKRKLTPHLADPNNISKHFSLVVSVGRPAGPAQSS